MQKKDAEFAEIQNYRDFIRKYNERYFTPQLENFLCFSTRFQEDERLTVEQALNHMYFANFDSKAFLASCSKQTVMQAIKKIKNSGLFRA